MIPEVDAWSAWTSAAPPPRLRSFHRSRPAANYKSQTRRELLQPPVCCRQTSEYNRARSTQSSASGCTCPTDFGIDGRVSRAAYRQRTAMPVLVEVPRHLPSAILFRGRVQDVSRQPSSVVRIPKRRPVAPVTRSTGRSRQRLSACRRDLRPGLARRRDSRSR